MFYSFLYKTRTVNKRVFTASTIYVSILLLIQCYVNQTSNNGQCVYGLDDDNGSIYDAERYYSSKTAYLQALPPVADVYLDIDGLSGTFNSVPWDKSYSMSHHEIPPMYNMKQSDVDAVTNNVRVLCLVLTFPANHYTKAVHVRDTWGKRCNKLLFISSEDDPELPTLNLQISANNETELLWTKMKAAFKYVYNYHLQDADWFVKADDDTYMILENLRYLLMQYDTNYPFYFGWPQTSYERRPYVTYMNGGAGYVISRATLRRFVDVGLRKTVCSASNVDYEDLMFGKCMMDLGIKPTHSRDQNDFLRFYPLRPRDYFFPTKNAWYWVHGPPYEGFSDTAVSFHRMEPHDMYILEYLIYRIGYCCKWHKNAWEDHAGDVSFNQLIEEQDVNILSPNKPTLKCHNKCYLEPLPVVFVLNETGHLIKAEFS